MTMKSFPDNLKFRYSWRPYQKRILDELEQYLNDDHLHIVAAPGSGKTILGLEVVLRINQPTIILAPTIAIKNQWVDRFIDNFIPDQKRPDWLSDDIKNPSFLTVSTYQGLYSAFTGDESENSTGKTKISKEQLFIESLQKNAIKTIVVDEAHHLRKNWWRCLKQLKSRLEFPTVIALTATPPYDVSNTEWERYSQFSGTIDAQVPVPELVKEKNLCPHQDYILFSYPTEEESKQIVKFRKSIWKIIEEINEEGNLVKFLKNHPWITDPKRHIEKILDDPSYFSSIIIYLHSQKVLIPKKAINIITHNPKSIPENSLEWMEILLTGLLYSHSQKDEITFLEDIKNKIKKIGGVERRKVQFEGIYDVEQILKQSLSKLKSITKIVEHEYSYLRDNLRMVILTDFIRKEYLPKSKKEKTLIINKIGVIPIFESLRRKELPGLKLGVLTGSQIIIPNVSTFLLEQVLKEENIDEKRITTSPLAIDSSYLNFEFKGTDKRKRVEIITELFSRGGINVLVGTKSLLGEGWDAPCINSLILATFVGSYMLSNQMRGRAIRVDSSAPYKTANVWHLISIDLPSLKSKLLSFGYTNEAGKDYSIAERRFKGFLGVDFEEPVIKNGLERLNLKKPPLSQKEIDNYNRMTITKSQDREKMSKQWTTALKGKGNYKLIQDIRTQKMNLPRSFVFANTIAAILWQGLFWSSFLLSSWMRGLSAKGSFDISEIVLLLLSVGFLLAILVFMPFFLKATWLFIRHGPIKGSMKQVAAAVLKSLCEIGVIRTPYKIIEITSEKDKDIAGAVRLHIAKCTKREKSIFLDALEELLNPVKNPRYLLKRKSILGRFIKREDYLAVPTILGANKTYAIEFSNNWAKKVGRMELIYTRTFEGRKILLRARTKSLSAAFMKKTERISSWK